MSDVVIRAEGLGKKYLIGHQADGERYTALRDVIARGARGLARSAADILRGRALVAGDEVEEFWALKDVSFEVKRGEVVGIIGRNGAGKSTLLKVLSRITEPSAGRVTIKGRVASLLEVGTGFHPELTGRENIYLNGAILGMTRAEIRRKFDEIVAFAEVERFLDTPVKRYSSGMYVRLAFAVAAHLEPEILVVDEVLAVGDAEFQRKCLGKMGEVAKGGRTVLFVSHNLGAVQELCATCILLTNGKLQSYSTAEEVVQLYTTLQWPHTAMQPKYEAPNLKIHHLTFKNTGSGLPGPVFGKDANIEISFQVQVERDDPSLHIGYALYSNLNRALWWSFFGDNTGRIGLKKGRHTLATVLPGGLLNDGRYIIEVLVAQHALGWIAAPTHRDLTGQFEIRGGALGTPLVSATSRPGLLMPVFDWQIEHADSVCV